MTPELQKYFIQYMLNKKCVLESHCEEVVNKLNGALEKEANLQSLINHINAKVHEQHFRIDTRTCEVTGKTYVVWISVRADKKSQNSDIKYFYTLLRELITSEERRLEKNHCLNIASELRILLQKAEEYLNAFATKGYVTIVDEFVYVGPRTISELLPYIMENFEGYIKKCNLCVDNVFYGQSCSKCDQTFHKYCLEKKRMPETCPLCNTNFIDEEDE